MSERHPYALLRCDACGCLLDASHQAGEEGPADSEPGAAGFSRRTIAQRSPRAMASAGDSGSGLLMFVRGGEVRYEEPPLCARCSVAIGVTALVRWAEEEEEG
jgi:hypothetical protein